MKGVSMVFILLFVQAHAYFFDDFRGAISNINQGFSKLFGDVVTDVKDTVYCTISAVEEVLVQNGLLDKRTLYNQKCKGIEKPKEESLNFRDGSHSKTISKIRKHSVIHHKHSSRRVSHETELSIKNVNKTIIDVLGNQNKDLKKNDNLAEISKILKQESENISYNFKSEINKLHFGSNNQSSVESIWKEIKLLNDLQRKSKNDTEINEIRRIFDKLTDQMHLKMNNQTILDNHELEELKKELQKYSSNNGRLNSTTENRLPQISESKSAKPEKSIFNLGLDSITSLFNSMTGGNDINNARKIVEDSQHSEKVLNDLFKG